MCARWSDRFQVGQHRRGGRIALAQPTGTVRREKNDRYPAGECGETGNRAQPRNRAALDRRLAQRIGWANL